MEQTEIMKWQRWAGHSRMNLLLTFDSLWWVSYKLTKQNYSNKSVVWLFFILSTSIYTKMYDQKGWDVGMKEKGTQ